jgi:hypothetical protein
MGMYKSIPGRCQPSMLTSNHEGRFGVPAFGLPLGGSASQADPVP